MLVYYLILSFLIGAITLLNRNRTISIILLALFLTLQTGLTVYGYLHLSQEDSGYFTFDATGIIFLCVLTILSYTTIWHSYKYLQYRKDDERIQSMYFAALIGLILSMSCAYLASHIAVMWAFIEATTLCVAVLIYHERTNLALEATWKYIFICSVGIAMAFVGIIFLSKAIQEAGSVNLSFSAISHNIKYVNVFWLKYAFLFMVVGFSTKMGLFPMHTICVDAHTVAPPPISAFISTTLMNVGFVAIFRTYSLMAHTAIQPWMNQILLWSGLLSIFISAVYLLKVNHFKRMNAYSSLEHMGLAAIGLACGGIGYFAAIFHLILHSFVKASAFYQIDQVHRTYHTYIISKTGNYFNKNITGALVMLLVFISITAFPPSGMFITEIWIFKSLFASSNFLVLILVLLFLAMIIYSLGRNFFGLLFNQVKDTPEIKVKIHPSETISQYVLLLLVIYLGLNPPEEMIRLIQEAVKNL